MTEAILVVYTSENGRDGWTPVEPFAVPEWVKDPDVISRLVAGQMAMNPRSESGINWFRAERWN